MDLVGGEVVEMVEGWEQVGKTNNGFSNRENKEDRTAD